MKTPSKRAASIAVLINLVILISFSVSCNRSSNEADLPAVSVVNIEEAPPVEMAGSSEGLITFLTGDVLRIGSSGESYPEIGETVSPGDIIITGADGFAELQFGNLGAVRIQADTRFVMDNIALNSDSGRASGSLSFGTIVARIRILGDGDAFEVSVPGAVCAVRGTRFMVNADPEGEVSVAVSEGRVTVAPPSLALVGAGTEENAVLSPLRDVMPSVGREEVLVIPFEDMKAVDKEIIAWRQEVPEGEASIEEMDDTVNLVDRVRSLLENTSSPQPIGSKAAAVLKDESPGMLPLSVTSDGNEDENREITLASLTVRTIPDSTRIMIDEKAAGSGSVSRVFMAGSSVSLVAISLDGRRQEKELLIEEPTVIEFVFEDPEIPEAPDEAVSEAPVSLETESEDSPEKLPPPEPLSDSVESAITEKPESVTDIAASAVAVVKPETPAVEEEAPTAAVVDEEPARAVEPSEEMEIVVDVMPSDATVYIDDSRSGRGSARILLKSDDHLSLRVERPGYQPFLREISGTMASPRMRIELRPRPVIARTSLNGGGGIGTLRTAGERVFGLTRDGHVFSVNNQGEILWNRDIGQQDGETLTLEVAGGRAYLMAGGALKLINLSNGRVSASESIPQNASSAVERRPVLGAEYLIVPTERSLLFAEPSSGKSVKNLDLPQGSLMSPALWKDKVLLADRKGTLLVINPKYQIISRTVDTGVGEPAGHAPVISRTDIAVYAGTAGAVCAVDLKSASVIWENSLGNAAAVVNHDPLISGGIVFFYAGGKIYSLDLGTGRERYTAISGLTSPPLIHNGILYACDESGHLALFDPRNGRKIGSLNLGERIVARPAALGTSIVVAGERRLIVVDPRSLTE